jgi:hypothetical protein
MLHVLPYVWILHFFFRSAELGQFNFFIDLDYLMFPLHNSCCLRNVLFSGYSNPPVHPLVVAVHPHDPNQFAVGLSDGSTKVLEPLESEGKWGTPAPADNGVPNGKTPASSATSNAAADQVQR